MLTSIYLCSLHERGGIFFRL
uniref:Uncharacterized protein n=1 Tax=Arundo donax TaxID=35708 RepID=A0A0A9BIL1_ARUDO